ncbi:MAG: hypothetical protein IT375_03835, partial [Polyangiaceae bacterium]|nr:hypothetical protein [Polyangiaceae bacterium]
MAEALEREARKLTWSGQAVDIGQIDSELVRLRYQAAGVEAGRELFAIRTSLFNLIVYTSDREAARDAMEVITGMAHHHPSRAIVVIAEPSDGESRIDAELAAHCHVNPGLEQQVCCEELSL